MEYLYSTLVLGTICVIAQIIYENTKWTLGHITSLFVVLGALLETFSVFDKLLEIAPAGASLAILSFGHLLTHSAVNGAKDGIVGILKELLVPASSSLVTVIVLSFLASLFKKSHL